MSGEGPSSFPVDNAGADSLERTGFPVNPGTMWCLSRVQRGPSQPAGRLSAVPRRQVAAACPIRHLPHSARAAATGPPFTRPARPRPDPWPAPDRASRAQTPHRAPRRHCVSAAAAPPPLGLSLPAGTRPVPSQARPARSARRLRYASLWNAAGPARRRRRRRQRQSTVRAGASRTCRAPLLESESSRAESSRVESSRVRVRVMAMSGDETSGQLLLQLLERRAGRRSYYCDSGYTSSNHSRQTSFGEHCGPRARLGGGSGRDSAQGIAQGRSEMDGMGVVRMISWCRY